MRPDVQIDIDIDSTYEYHMRFVVYTNALSEHQMPIAKEIVKRIGTDNFKYIYTSKNGQKLQESRATDSWIAYLPIEKTNDWLENADVMLVGGIRPIDLMEKRLAAGKITLYMSERWFKPIQICRVLNLPGWVRLMVPSYWRMAKRFAKLFESPYYRFLPIGPWSLLDMKRICRIMGIVVPGNQVIKWGDFVAPSQLPHSQLTHSSTLNSSTLKVLWVGRFLNWKRVDTIIRAVGELSKSHSPTPNSSTPPLPHSQLTLDLYGTGPEEKCLKKLASQYGDVIKFYPPVPIADVRKLMREHDVYVLASNAYEGWGAVVSEALEEGMRVIGTYEAGASAAILSEKNLFHSGDWKTLVKKLISGVPHVPIGEWSAERAAKRLFKELGL